MYVSYPELAQIEARARALRAAHLRHAVRAAARFVGQVLGSAFGRARAALS